MEYINAHGIAEEGVSFGELGWPFKFVVTEALDSCAFGDGHASSSGSDPCPSLLPKGECGSGASGCGIFKEFP